MAHKLNIWKFLTTSNGFLLRHKLFMCKMYMQGCVQEFEKAGCNLKWYVFRPKLTEEQKKQVNTSADVQFSGPKSTEEQKKGHHALRLSFIRTSPLHHKSFMHLYVGGARPQHPPLDMPQIWLFYWLHLFSGCTNTAS